MPTSRPSARAASPDSRHSEALDPAPAADVLVVLFLQTKGFRWLEALVIVLQRNFDEEQEPAR